MTMTTTPTDYVSWEPALDPARDKSAAAAVHGAVNRGCGEPGLRGRSRWICTDAAHSNPGGPCLARIHGSVTGFGVP